MRLKNQNIVIKIIILFIILFSFQLSFRISDASYLPKEIIKTQTNDSKLKVLIISSNISDRDKLANAAKENVIIVQYDHEKTSLSQLVSMVKSSLCNRKVSSIGIATHNYGTNQFYITKENIISINSTRTDIKQQKFWHGLCDMLVENGRIDLFACSLVSNNNGRKLIAELESVSNKNFAASMDITGNHAKGGNWLLETDNIDLSDQYFSFQKLNRFTGIFATLGFTASDITGDTGISSEAVMGDVDGDGDLDIYATIFGTQNKLWINNGSGSFTASDITDDTGNSFGAVMGDVDGDGDLDIYVANFYEQNKLWINDGSGSFTSSDITGDTGNSFGAAMGDVDGDGDLDIYVTNQDAQNRLWINDGSGSFTASDITDDTGNSFGAVMGDVDGDGDLDIYVANDGQNKLWINNGSGSFTASDIEEDTGVSYGALMGDVDGDGDLDIYIANDGNTQNKLWINNGSGSFSASDISGDTGASYGAVMGDADNDGDLDIYVANNGNTQNKLWINNGSGSFTASDITDDTGNSFGGVMGDVDNDGDLDIYVTNQDAQNKLWINTLTRDTKGFSADDITGDEGNSRGVVMGDVDNDGDLDIHVSNYNEQNKLWINNGSGSFTASDISSDTGASYGAIIGDVDKDGDLDIYVANYDEQNKLWINDGSGSFTASDITNDTGKSYQAVMGDVDKDGDLDIYVANEEQNKLWINDGSGSFTASDISGDTGFSIGAVMGDVDKDGDLDIYVANYNEQNKLWINDGAGSFTASDISGDTGNSRKAAMGDVDNDGDLDIYVANQNTQNKLWINDGSGSFSASDISGDTGLSYDAIMVDVDNDGDIDIYVSNYNEQNKLWINNGSGSFSASDIRDDTGPSSGAAMGDVDNDGDLDIYASKMSAQNKLWKKILIKEEPSNHPTGFSATANSSSQITTSWTDSTGGTLPGSYLVMCKTSDSFSDPVDTTAQSDDTDCSDGSGVKNITQGTGTYAWTGLSSGTQYYFKIFPYTNSGAYINYKTDGTPATDNATTQSKPEPSNHPTGFSATANSSSQITTSWTDSTGETLPGSYLVMCKTSDSFSDPVDTTAQSDDTDCSDGSGVKNITQGTGTYAWTGLNSTTQYYFKIFPYTNSGTNINFKIDGTPATDNATTQSKPEPSNHPTGFSATANSSSQITTSWTDSTGDTLPDSYLVMCKTSDSFSDPVDTTAQSDDTDCSDGSGVKSITQGTGTYAWTGLSGSTQYYFKIFPYTNSGANINYKIDGTPATDDATTQSKPEPSNHPTNFQAEEASSGIKTSWTDSTGDTLPDSYLVMCSTASDSFTNPVDTTSQSDDTDCSDGSGLKNVTHGTGSYTWAGLTSGTQYYFKIFPYTNSGSNIDFKIDGTPLSSNGTYDLPTVDAGTGGTKSAQFNLAGSASDTGSSIASQAWSKESGSGNVSFGDASSLTSTCSMDANGDYVLKLTATDSGGNTNSDTVTVTWTGSDDGSNNNNSNNNSSPPDDQNPDDQNSDDQNTDAQDPDDQNPDDQDPDDQNSDDQDPDDQNSDDQKNPLLEAVDKANDAIDKADNTDSGNSEKPTTVNEAVQKASDAVKLATEMIDEKTATPKQALITLDVVDNAFKLLGQSAKNGETSDIDTDNVVDTLDKVSNISKLAVETGQTTDEEKKSIVTTTDNILKSMPDIIASVDKDNGLKIIAQVDDIVESGLKAGLSSAGADTTKLTAFIDSVSDVITALALDTTITGNTNIVKSAVNIISKAVNTAKASANQSNESVVAQLQKETGSIIEAIHNNLLKNILPFSDLDQNKSFNQKSQAYDLTKAEDTPDNTIDKSLITKEKIKALTKEVSNIVKPFIDNSTPLGQTLLESILEVIDDAFESIIDQLALSRGIDTSTNSLVNNESGLLSAIQNHPSLFKDILEINSVDITKIMSESTLLGKIMMQQIAAGQLILSDTSKAIKRALPQVIDLDCILIEDNSICPFKALKNAIVHSIQNADASSLHISEPGMIKGTLKWDGSNTESHSILITSVKIIPSSVPDGIYLLPDGQLVTIYDNIAITAAPIFSDLFTLVDKLVSLDIGFKILDDCRWTAALNDESIITGMIAYREYSLPLIKETPNYDILFESIGDEASSKDYSIAAVYNESMFQLLPPALYSLDQLVQLLDKLQLKYTIDRDNGVITIQDAWLYKPDYIINALDSDDLQYWEQNKDELGIAWKQDDFNQDGIMDLEMLTSEGKQILYQIVSETIE